MSGLGIGTLAGIKRSAVVLGVVGLVFGAADVVGQSAGHSSSAVSSSQSAKDGTAQAAPRNIGVGVDVLSDTQGVDFSPYFRQSLQMIRSSWISLLPQEARPPFTAQNAQGETVIRFTIAPDGKIIAMHIDESSKQAKLDRAAWGAITGVGQFPALPKDFSGPNLELRIHFKVNLPATVNP
jgi:TonB family protein